jgi:nucleoside-diphosphate-sugar epimerase
LRGDVTDKASVAAALAASGAQVVYHMAGDTSVRRLQSNLDAVERSVRTNVLGSLNVIEAIHSHGPSVRCLVRPGGLEEYGRGSLPFDEGQREEPVSPYSASQVAVSHYMRMLQPHVGFDMVTLRLALVYGPGQSDDFLIPSLIASALAHRDFDLSSGDQGRDLIYVDDAVDALLRAGSSTGLGGEIINVASGLEYRIRDVAESVWKLAGARSRLNFAAAGERPFEMRHMAGRNDKAARLLDWRPTTTLEDGLAMTIADQRRGATPSRTALA